MTALAFIATDNAAWIASDGAAYTDDGVLRMILPKVLLCPDWDCVIGGRGAGLCVDLFRHQGDMAGVRDFDDLLSKAPDLMRAADDASLCRVIDAANHFTIILCGFSRSRCRFEIHNIRTRCGTGWDEAKGEMVDVDPYTLSRLPAVALIPLPLAETAAAAGITTPGGPGQLTIENPERYVQTAVFACRYDPGRAEGDPEGAEHHSVGGFIQLTRLFAHPNPAPEDWPHKVERPIIVMDSQITHRWRDPLDQVIDPSQDVAPWWMLPPLPSSEERALEAAE